MVFESVLNPVFSPLLRLYPVVSLAIMASLMSLIITLIYKWMTDQNLMKQMKAEMKEFQKEIKELKNNPQKAMEVQKKALETNMKYMMHSMRPTLITFLPIILIFGWLSANLGYEPLQPDTAFATTATFAKGAEGSATINLPEALTLLGNKTQPIVDDKATWSLKGPTGEYFLEYEYKGDKKQKNLIITEQPKYAKIEERYKNSQFISIKINNNPIHPFGSFSLFGWHPGWLGAYIIFSLASSLLLRKVLKVY
jgi:uncharacterized membrane protein (DUF106 family)